MKILQIAPPWISVPPKGYGGTELVIYTLTEELVKLGHDLTLFATRNSKTSGTLEYVFDNGLYEQGLPWNGALPPLIHYQQAFKRFKEGDFDIAHVHLSSQTDLILFPFLSELKKPYVMTVHGHMPFDRYTNFDKEFFEFYGHKISGVAISKTMEALLPKHFRSDGYVYNGMEVEKMTFKDKPTGDYFTWIGRIVPDKGLHHAINVVKKTGQKLVFAGSVDKHNSDGGTDYFKEKIEPHIDGKQIVFLGEADFKMKNELFSNAKAFLNPIDWVEPFGMVMIESMACGTPVISFNKGAAKELIVEGKTGFLVENEEEMAKAITKVEQLDRKACREHVLANFTAKASAQGYLNIYYHKVREALRKKAILQQPKKILGGLMTTTGFSTSPLDTI